MERSYNAKSRTTIVRKDLPVAVLVDESSASASEIFAACLQDYERAVVIGERTWGKGTVQNITNLEGGRSALKLTVATYWRPSGKNIHRLSEDRDDNGEWGVRPNPGMEIEMSDDQLRKLYTWQRERGVIPTGENEDDEKQPRPDPVVNRAIEYLQKKIGS